MPALATKFQVGNFILIDTDDQGINRAAVILELLPDCIIAQEYYANRQRTRWLPVWITDELGNETAKQKHPTGSSAKTITLQPDNIVYNGYIDKTTLTDETKRRLLAKGFDWALPPTKVTSAANISAEKKSKPTFNPTVQVQKYKSYDTPQHPRLAKWTQLNERKPTHFMPLPFPTLENKAPHFDQIVYRITYDGDTGEVIEYLDVHEKYDLMSEKQVQDINSKLPEMVTPSAIITRLLYKKHIK